MKNLKKVLALAVAFVMCFTMFAGATVYSDVPAGSDYSEAVTLLSDLGIIAGMPDGSFGVDRTITRADAACLIARMLTGETMPSKYAGASNFTDVPKDAYYESAVAYCAIMGITQGTSTTLGTYSPSREITDGEFIAMITRALGYDSAANPLSFPMGNIARAQQEGILDNVNVVADSPALRGEDAMMIYNALFADYDEYAKQQNIYQAADDHTSVTIAEKVFGLDRLARVENKDRDGNLSYSESYKSEIENSSSKCLAHTWVVVGVDPREAGNTYTAYPISDKTNKIDIDELETLNALEDDYKDDEEYAPITFIYDGDPAAILGYQVELWGELDHNGVDEIIKAVKTVKGQKGYDWQLSDGEDGSDKLTVSGGTVNAKEAPIAIPNLMEKDDGDEKKDIHTDTGAWSAFDLVVFDDEDGDYGIAHKWDFKDGDSYRLVDWDSDGKIDFGIKTVRKYAEVTNIDKEDITFSGIVNKQEDEVTYEIDDDQLKFACEGIQEGDVIEMTVSRAYNKGEDGEIVTIGVEKVSSQIAELTKVSTKGELQMTFDGVIRELADDEDGWDLVENDANDLDESDLEGTYELWLDENGFIVKLEESDTNTGYLVALELEDGVYKTTKARSERAIMKAKLDDNTVYAFEVAFDLDIVGTVYDSTDTKREKPLEKRNINSNNSSYTDNNGKAIVQLYNSKSYAWVAPELVVGQVYKYWMDADKVITKLQRVTETRANSTDYWQNTGVVTVTPTTDFNNHSFNGNVYLKNSDVLFITADDFVKHDYSDGVSSIIGRHPVYADEDDVLAIEPTTANLKAISLGDRIANSSLFARTLAKNDDLTVSPANSYSNLALYRKAKTGDTPYNIAYDVNKDGYANAAIMAIDNFDAFDKSTVVALITDASAQNRKNTIFEIEGAVAGKVGTFTSVEEDGGASDLFYYYDPEYAGKDQAVAYDDLNAVRDAIDNNGLYAEVSLNADGKVTKVVIMTDDGLGNVVGPNYMVARLGAGINMEVGKDGYASFITNLDGANILRYATDTTLYALESVQWQRSFGVTGSTQVYTISNKLEKIMEGVKNSLLQTLNAKTGLTNMTAEPSISAATAADIVSSSNKNNQRNVVDKYAVMDVAFDRDDVYKITQNGVTQGAPNTDKYVTPTKFEWRYNSANAPSTIGYALNGKDAVAVFSYTKRFGESEVDGTILSLISSTPKLNVAGNATQADVKAEFVLTNGANAIKSLKLTGPDGKSQYITVNSTSVKMNDGSSTTGTITIPSSNFKKAGKWTLEVTDNKNQVSELEFTVAEYEVAEGKFLTAEVVGTLAKFTAGVANSGQQIKLKVADTLDRTKIEFVDAPTGFSLVNDNNDTDSVVIKTDETVKAGTYRIVLKDKSTGAVSDPIVITVDPAEFKNVSAKFNGSVIVISVEAPTSYEFTSEEIESVTVDGTEVAVTGFKTVPGDDNTTKIYLQTKDPLPTIGSKKVIVQFADSVVADDVECAKTSETLSVPADEDDGNDDGNGGGGNDDGNGGGGNDDGNGGGNDNDDGNGGNE